MYVRRKGTGVTRPGVGAHLWKRRPVPDECDGPHNDADHDPGNPHGDDEPDNVAKGASPDAGTLDQSDSERNYCKGRDRRFQCSDRTGRPYRPRSLREPIVRQRPCSDSTSIRVWRGQGDIQASCTFWNSDGVMRPHGIRSRSNGAPLIRLAYSMGRCRSTDWSSR